MAQSDARFGYRANLGRTDHNLSQPLGFSACPGMLLPIWYDFSTPGDSYYMSHDLPLLRSIQLLAPSMVNVKVHYETFFVPIQMILQTFEQSAFSLATPQSSLYSMINPLNTNLPCWDYDTYIKTRLQQYSGTPYKTKEHQDGFRLADLFGLCPCNFTANSSSGGGVNDGYFKWYAPKFFPYQILTYNTIFQYYYRLDDKSSFTNKFSNWDMNCSSATVYENNYNFFKIHQRPWDFDYYTSIYRSPLISSSNTLAFTPSTDAFENKRLTLYAQSLSSSLLPPGNNNDLSTIGSNVPNANVSNINGAVSPLMIRQLFANEKLAMISGRTKKNYDSQVLAHYGVSVPHDVKHDLTLIHSDVYELNVQEVTSLASTSESPLGELAGKSYAAGSGKQFKFTAPCHGVIMTIFSIEPKKRYITGGFDRINAISDVYDLPTPEFDRLGNVPMFRYEAGIVNVGDANDDDIVGWKERYYQYKRKPAKVTFGYWVANGVNNYGSYFINSLPFGQSVIGKGIATLPDAAKPRPDLENRFYIERGCLDNQVYQPYFDGWMQEQNGENWDLTPWLLYSRDPFIINSHIKCKKVSWMSKDGEPIYD